MTLVVKGKIVSGKGVGRLFLEERWVMRQIQEKVGFTPFQGTLNIQMNKTTRVKLRSFVQSHEGIRLNPIDNRFRTAKCFPITMMDTLRGAVIFPLVPAYPPDQLEIVAPMNLRERFKLKDGDEIVIEILTS